MNKEKLIEQLTKWHENDEYQKIIDEILKIPESERDYDLINHLGRAYNNVGRYSDAIDLFMSVAAQGQNDALWHFRMGYAYYWLSMYEDALREFETSYRLDAEDSDVKSYIDSCRSYIDQAENSQERRKYSKDIFVP